MALSQKCRYALRAVFELARRDGQGPAKIAEIAEVQAIPPRFLEVILSQLKQGGFVESRRGNQGGYFLVRSPRSLSVGEIISFVQGPVAPVNCAAGDDRNNCPLYGDCVFLPMWEKARKAMSDVYDKTTFQDLVEEGKKKVGQHVPCYSI